MGGCSFVEPLICQELAYDLKPWSIGACPCFNLLPCHLHERVPIWGPAWQACLFNTCFLLFEDIDYRLTCKILYDLCLLRELRQPRLRPESAPESSGETVEASQFQRVRHSHQGLQLGGLVTRQRVLLTTFEECAEPAGPFWFKALKA